MYKGDISPIKTADGSCDITLVAATASIKCAIRKSFWTKVDVALNTVFLSGAVYVYLRIVHTFELRLCAKFWTKILS